MDVQITKLIEFYEINPMLNDSTDANYRNRDLKRIIHTCCNETGVQDMKMLVFWPKLVFNSQRILIKKEVRSGRPTHQMCTQNIARGQSNLT